MLLPYPAYNKYLLKEWFDKTVLVEFEGRKGTYSSTSTVRMNI